MNGEHYRGINPLASFDLANLQGPGKLQCLFIDSIYHKLGISVAEGHKTAVAIGRGQDAAAQDVRRFTAFFPSLACSREAVIAKAADPESAGYPPDPEFIVGVNTVFLAVGGGNISEELEFALVDMGSNVPEPVLQKAFDTASDPERRDQHKRSLCIRYGNTLSMMCEAIDISAHASFNHKVEADQLASYTRGCYAALFTFVEQMESGFNEIAPGTA